MHRPCCTWSVRPDLRPNIFSSSPPTQSINTYYLTFYDFHEAQNVKPLRVEIPGLTHKIVCQPVLCYNIHSWRIIFLYYRCVSDKKKPSVQSLNQERRVFRTICCLHVTTEEINFHCKFFFSRFLFQ